MVDDLTGVSGRGTPQRTAKAGFPAGDGEMGSLVRSLDWARTALGPVESWPQSLRTVVSILLTSRYAMWMGWGDELTFLYNDAYRPTLGIKHPWALGTPAHAVWAEIWRDIGPRIATVLTNGEATYDEGLFLVLERSGFPEETYHTFSYSPLADDSGKVNGMLCVVTEETERIIGERRMALLRELGSELAATNTQEDVWAAVERRVRGYAQDLPFALVYLFEPGTAGRARLVCAAGITAGHRVAPEWTGPGTGGAPWPAEEIFAHAAPIVIDDLAALAEGAALPTGAWDRPPRQAAVVPLKQQGQERSAGFLVAALNPYRRYDATYAGFVDLLAGQVAAGLANARSYEEERKRAEALAELDRAKTAFFSNVSHEFRTPLTLMLGPLEEMQALGSALLPQVSDLAAVIHRNGLRLQKLVNTLLDFSRIEAGRMQAFYEPTDLAALTAELASTFRSAMEKAGLRLTVDCPPLREPVHVDREMWEKVVLNLLSNAYKHTFEGAVTVRVGERGGWAVLSVEDTGTGIPAAELPHVFERFHRVEGARGRTLEGTGIGLALVAELVNLHGGAVEVESTVGKGSTFTVALPFGSAHLPAGQNGRPTGAATLRVDAYVEEALRWLPEGQAAAAVDGLPAGQDVIAAPRPVQPVAGTPAGGRVLLADDNADMRDYVRRLLGERYEVTATADGKEALALALDDPPDLVLSDVMMPGLDGFGLLQALRAHPQTRAVPVLLLSARAGEESRLEGLDAGADDYLVKPFTARELLARVATHLGMARARRQAATREAMLRAEAEAARDQAVSVLESITDGFVALDREWRFTYVNAEAERLNGMRREEVLGRSHWEVFPATTGTMLEREYRRAAAERVTVEFENHYAPQDRWYHIKAYPAADGGFSIFYEDITERKRAEEALKSSEERFRRLYDANVLGVAYWDADGRVTAANDAFLATVGYTRAEFEAGGIDWIALTAPEHRERDERALIELRARGVAPTYEKDFVLRDGRRVSIVLGVAMLGDWQREGIAFIVDVTERKRAEEALRESEERFRTLVDSAKDHAIVGMDRKGRITNWNAGAERLLGWTEAEILGQPAAVIFTPEDREKEAPEQELSTARAQGQASDERWHMRKDGTRFWGSGTVTPVQDDTGVMTGFVKVFQNRTREWAVREALRESESRLRLAQRAGRIGTFEWFMAENRIVWTPELEALYGVPEGTFEGKFEDWSRRVVPEDAQAVIAGIQECVAGRQTEHDYEFRAVLPDGSRRWLRGQAQFTYDEAGGPVRMLGINIDIDERKRAEEALRRSEDRYRAFVAQSSEGIWRIELREPLPVTLPVGEQLERAWRDAYLAECNDAMARMYGFTSAREIVGAPMEALLPSSDARNVAYLRTFLESGYRLTDAESHEPARDGQWRVMRNNLLGIVEDGHLVRAWGTQRDITEQRRSEEALRESEERFRTLANHMSQFAWMADETGLVFWYNQRWYDYTGTTLEQMQDWRWQKVHHPEHIERVIRSFQGCIERGEPWEDTFPLRSKNGEYCWFLSRALPIRDAEGKVVRWFGTNTDVTAQLETEKELRRANQDLEQFAFSASHDLQEPLRNVGIYSQLLTRRYRGKLDAEAEEYLGYLVEGAQRMATLVSDLLAYTEAAALGDEPVGVALGETAFAQAVAGLRGAVRESGAVVTHDPLPAVAVKDVHLQQLLQNLVGNAIKYRQDGERPRVHVSAVRENGHWRFSVQDNGIGIAPQYHSQVFGIFKRLHAKGSKYAGTGIGLAICQKIVDRYGGQIWVESAGVGAGSTFFFTVPGVGE